MNADAPDGSPAGEVDDDAPLDPATSAALIEAQRAKVVSATDVDGRLLFGLWGIAWLLGFGGLWATALDEPLVDVAPATALAVFMVLILTAVVLTIVHVARRSAGVHGASAQQGAMYGWAWFLAFMGVAALGYALGQIDVGIAGGSDTTSDAPIAISEKLRKKLGEVGHYIETLRGVGYRFLVPEPGANKAIA